MKTLSAQTLVLFMLLVTPLFTGCTLFKQTYDAALDKAADLIPAQVVQHLDTQSWQAISKSLTLIQDPVAINALSALAKPITQKPPGWIGETPQWRFNIIASPELNAFALPGGTIAVNTGLIVASESGLEVVGVLGHEVAHVLERHGMKSMVINSGASLALSLVLGDLAGLSGIALNTAANLGLLKFSRDHEREADRVGAKLLQNANYPSVGLATFFSRLQAQKDQGNSDSGEKADVIQSALSLLSTHPMSEERAKALEQLVATNPNRTLDPATAKTYATLRGRILQILPTLPNNPAKKK
jgi:predicted Zn-dependent protease